MNSYFIFEQYKLKFINMLTLLLIKLRNMYVCNNNDFVHIWILRLKL